MKGLKLKVRKFWGLIPSFVEVTGEKLVGGGGAFWSPLPPLFWIGLIISNEEVNDIIKVIEDSNILLKGVTETIKNETKKQEGGFLGILVDTLGSILLRNLLSRKGIVRAGS